MYFFEFVLIFTYLILNTPTSSRALICCAAIIIGYAAGVLIEGNLGTLSILGTLFGIGSSVTCALNSIYTAKTLPKVEGSVWVLTFYANIDSLILSIPIIAILEGESLINQLPSISFVFWFFMIISGLMGFAIGYVSALQIQVTSPLTHNVSGTAKAAAQTVLAVLIYQEIKSVSWWLSNLIVLLASAAYAYVRQTESMKKSAMFHQNESDKHAKTEASMKKPLV